MYLCWIGNAEGPREEPFEAKSALCLEEAWSDYWDHLREHGFMPTGGFGLNITVAGDGGRRSGIELVLYTEEVPRTRIR